MNYSELENRVNRLAKNIAHAGARSMRDEQASTETIAAMFEDSAAILGEAVLDLKRIADALTWISQQPRQ